MYKWHRATGVFFNAAKLRRPPPVKNMISIPFTGSKRNRYREIKAIVEENGYKTVYEPFGGSAVLSVNLYNDEIINKAVINDYDGLFDLYPEYLDIKDRVIKQCLDAGMSKSEKKLPAEHCKLLQEIIADIDPKYWHELSTNFVFSARRTSGVRLSDFVYFTNDITTDRQRAYLEIVNQLERNRLDYRDFVAKHKGDLDDKTLLIVDPPYINAYQKAYSNQVYFGLAETIELLNMLHDLQTDFVFFNMVQDDMVRLLELYRYGDIYVSSRKITAAATVKRDDCMIYIKA